MLNGTFMIVALICSLSDVPDRSDCKESNALYSHDVGYIEGGIACTMNGFQFLAQHFSIDDKTEYTKVICRPPLVDLAKGRG